MNPFSRGISAVTRFPHLLCLLAAGLASVALPGCGGGGGGGSNGSTGNPSTVKGTVPRFAFTVSGDFNQAGVGVVSGHTVDFSTGRLRHNGYAPAGSFPSALDVDPSDRFVYAANRDSNDVSAFRIDAGTGTLTAIGAPVAAGDAPSAIVVDPTGKFVFASNRNGHSVSAYRVNENTGALTAIDADAGAMGIQHFPAGNSPVALAVDPTGRFVFATNELSDNVSAYMIDGTTGALTPIDADAVTAGIQHFAAGDRPVAVAVEPAGKAAYVVNQADGTVSAYRIDAASGALSLIDAPDPTGGATSIGVAIDPSGNFAYVVNNGGDLSAFRIAVADGGLSVISCSGGAGCNGDRFQTVPGARAVTVDPSGTYLYAAGQGANESYAGTHRIDAVTGVLSKAVTTAGLGGRGVAIAAGTTAVRHVTTFAFVSSAGFNKVEVLRIDAATGALAAAGTLTDGIAGPAGTAIDPLGRFAYVANKGGSNVTGYTVHAATGALTRVPGSGTVVPSLLPGGSFTLVPPAAVVTDPSGRFAYVASPGTDEVSAFAFHAVSGVLSAVLCTGNANCAGVPNRVKLSPLAGVNFGPGSLAFDPAGRFILTANRLHSTSHALSIHPVTGAHSDAGSSVAGPNPYALAISPTRPFVYFALLGSDSVVACRVSAFGSWGNCETPVAAGTDPFSVTVDPTARFAYAANALSDDISAYAIDDTGGVLTEIACGAPAACNGNRYMATGSTWSVTVDSSGQFLFAAGPTTTSAFGIDAATGTLTLIGSVPVSGEFITSAGRIQ